MKSILILLFVLISLTLKAQWLGDTMGEIRDKNQDQKLIYDTCLNKGTEIKCVLIYEDLGQRLWGYGFNYSLVCEVVSLGLQDEEYERMLPGIISLYNFVQVSEDSYINSDNLLMYTLFDPQSGLNIILISRNE